jgi:hypothetical protein
MRNRVHLNFIIILQQRAFILSFFFYSSMMTANISYITETNYKFQIAGMKREINFDLNFYLKKIENCFKICYLGIFMVVLIDSTQSFVTDMRKCVRLNNKIKWIRFFKELLK